MNQESRTKDMQPVYPHYLNGYEQQDEISLVDLWIALLRYKKVFVLSLAILVILGIFAVTMLITPKYMMTTVLEVASLKGEPIESTEAVINRAVTIIIPEETRKVTKMNNWDSFKTMVSSAEGTNLVTIENRVKKSDVTTFEDFQSKISSAIIVAHKRLLLESNAFLLKSVTLEEALKPEPLTREAYIKKYKPEVQKNIELVDVRIKALNQLVNQPGVQSGEGIRQLAVVSQEAVKMFAERIALAKEITDGYDQYVEKIEESERKILELKNDIEDKLTQVGRSAQLSLKPVSLSKNKAYIIVILLSIFLAFVFTLIVMFRAKVIEKMSQEV